MVDHNNNDCALRCPATESSRDSNLHRELKSSCDSTKTLMMLYFTSSAVTAVAHDDTGQRHGDVMMTSLTDDDDDARRNDAAIGCSQNMTEG